MAIEYIESGNQHGLDLSTEAPDIAETDGHTTQSPVEILSTQDNANDQAKDYPESHIEASVDIDNVESGGVRNWIKRHKLKLALGVAATSLAVTMINDPFESTKEQVLGAAPWVGGGLVASEAMFIAGAGMMLTSVGEKIGNPLTIKRRTSDIAEKAKDSKLFKAGFVVNTVGAVGDFAVLSAGVMRELPPHSWGILSLTLIDLGVTVAFRKAILDSVNSNPQVAITDTSE